MDTEMQGRKKYILGSTNKIEGFYIKLKFWLKLTGSGYKVMFPAVFNLHEQKHYSVSMKNI
jgi:hypothetical protein